MPTADEHERRLKRLEHLAMWLTDGDEDATAAAMAHFRQMPPASLEHVERMLTMTQGGRGGRSRMCLGIAANTNEAVQLVSKW
jgi:hypothetical protein